MFAEPAVTSLTARPPSRHAPAMPAAPPSAAAIWRAASNADRDTGLARAHLASRGVWPPWRPLPPAVRFVAATAAPAALALLCGVAGAIVFAYTAGAGRKARIADLAMEVLTGEGQALEPRWRRQHVEMAGGAFGMCGPGCQTAKA